MNAPDVLELDTGQFALVSDVVERNGQQAFPEAARPAEPAPIEPTGDFGAEQELERRAAADELDSDYRCPDCGFGPRATPQASHAPDCPRQPVKPAKKPSSRKPARRKYHCALCGRELPHERWVYSRHTGSRYCTPGEGCATPAAIARRARATEKRKEQRRKEAA